MVGNTGGRSRVKRVQPKQAAAPSRADVLRTEEQLEGERVLDPTPMLKADSVGLRRAMRLQGLAGNQAVARLVASNGLLQRHSIAEAPPLPAPPSEEELAALAGTVQRLTFGGQSAFGKQPTVTVQRVLGERVKLIQQRVKYGPVKLVPDSLPADSTSTSQASAPGLGAGQITWSFLGTDYGSTIDANSGVVTAGKMPANKTKELVEVAAHDKAQPDKGTLGGLTLWEPQLLKATADYETFLKQAPYVYPDFTVGLNGKFDLTYSPASRLAKVTVKVKFDAPEAEDQPQPGETPKQTKERLARVDGYRKSFTSRITQQWSRRYQFKNIREPQSVWGKLNPTNVEVEVVPVATNQHFTVNFMPRTKGSAAVGGGVANMKAGPAGPVPGQTYLEPREAFPDTGTNEADLVNKITPSVRFAAKSDAVVPKYDESLSFLADYLKRLNNPKFILEIKGRSNSKAEGREVARRRAQSIQAYLTSKGLTNHSWKITTEELAGDTGQDVNIIAGLQPGWKNRQDVTAHEFGHMIGLGDEYQNANAVANKSSHYALVKKAFGEKYAEKVARVDLGDRASVMEGGNDVRIQHYVTFWNALVETTLQKANVPDTKFGYDDWKFIG